MGKHTVIVAFGAVVLFACLTLTVAQWNTANPNNYVTYNPQLSQGLTFSDLNTYTTPYPYTNGYNTQNLNQIRIWPYVIGQYLYPQSNLYNNVPYNSNNNNNNNIPNNNNNNNNLVPYNNNNLLTNTNTNSNVPYGSSNSQLSWYSAIYPYGQTTY